MSKKFKIFSIFLLILNLTYVAWLTTSFVGPLGLIFTIAEILIILLSVLFIINHWKQHHVTVVPVTPKGQLDILLPVVDEPLEMFKKTLSSAMEIDYLDKQIYILDDGGRDEIRQLAEYSNIKYLNRDNRNNAKAGNLNFALKKSKGEFILVLDADQVIEDHNIANELLGYFDDPKLAIVTTRQKFDVPKNDFNHDPLFYEHMQSGKNADNASVSCGSGVIYRRSALEKIGGFQTWNIVEDLYTSYSFHRKGFKTMYVNKPYSLGTAPMDLSTIYKQRGTWAVDTLRIFFKKPPFLVKGLKLMQRLHYSEIALSYLTSAISLPILFLLPGITLLTNTPIIDDPMMYLLLRVPSLLFVILFYYFLSDRSFSVSRFWAGLFPVYLQALIIAILPFKMKYKVTNKLAGVGKRDIALILPHIFLILFNLSVIVWRIIYIDQGFNFFIGVNLMWTVIMIFWFLPVIRKGLLLE